MYLSQTMYQAPFACMHALPSHRHLRVPLQLLQVPRMKWVGLPASPHWEIRDGKTHEVTRGKKLGIST